MLEFTESSGLLADAAALRARMDEQGYLFFRGLLPTEPLWELRDAVTRVLADQGWIRGGEQRLEALAASLPHREGEETYLTALREVMKLEQLHSLAHRPELLGVMRALLGEKAFPHPLCIARLVFPRAPELSTPPHQDYPNNQGTPLLTAAWIPLGDCPRERGSIAVLEGSHRFGMFPLQFHLGPGNRGAKLDERVRDCRWRSGDFRLGDVLLFPALTVHRALDNDSARALRLSVDFRYQPAGEALTPGCLEPHFGCLPWEEIYRGWGSDRYQYYWRRMDYEVVPWREDLHAIPAEHFQEALAQEIRFGKAVRQRYREILS